MLTVKDVLGRISVADMRRYFEGAINSTPALKANTPLGVMEINEQFAYYMDGDTDTMWIGFALGMRCAERVAIAAQQKGEA
ncbi:MAG TPA: hypothetical protein DHL02_14820 [Achromobacter sp.]|nr:hypothetical protein [Achromobacter sp.]